MNYRFVFLLSVIILNVIQKGCCSSWLNQEDKKATFSFSGNLKLDIKNDKENKLNDFEKNKNVERLNEGVTKIMQKEKELIESNKHVKDVVDEVGIVIKKKYNINELPPSGLTKDEEEDVKEDSAFLSDDLEEAAENFSLSGEKSDKENEQHENEIKDIRKYQAEIINSMNENTIYKKFDTNEFEKMKQKMEDHSEICYPDYSMPCPLHFFRTSTGCVPLRTYEGPCNKIQNKLIYLYDEQKASWAEICEANWPCMPLECSYGRDYNSVCPINWIDIGKGLCRNIYKNEKCAGDINFSNMSFEEKKSMEKKCGIIWKCKSITYTTNFDDICPLHWENIGNYKCKAPQDYKGPCPNISNLKKYNTQEKKENIENVCLVNWPYSIKVNEYQRDYNIDCPIGWSMMENGFCRAPENYKKSLKCKEEVSFDDMNADQKHSYSLACNVDFPFKDKQDCKRNYSFACPLGWIPSKKINYCKAPLNYKSSICKNVSKFKNISDNQKNYYLKFCDIDWPCEGEIQNSMIYTQISVDHLEEHGKKKYTRGPVDSETGLII
ncbi:CPW-WPC family protein [Plasmodium sp. gorilla clade G1]|nr:CPW-WPC family protein [Plasmodium sp. gorilla clade G1]